MQALRLWMFIGMILFTATFLSQGATGYTLAYSTNGNPLYWNLDEQPQGQPNIIEKSVEFFISRGGTADLPDNGDGTGGEFDILRSAFAVWQAPPSSSIRFNDLKTTDQTGIYMNDETNVVYFDESNTTGFFPEGTGIIALTMTTYEDETYDGVFDGRIRDTDLVFNGRDFTFSEGLEPGKMNLKAVAVHEIGHICGLDHSFHQTTNTADDTLLVPTMYPYIDYDDDQTVSLEQDDLSGMIELYPESDFVEQTYGSISGVVKLGEEYTPGVDVIAYRGQTPVVSAVTLRDGSFRIHGVPAGAYTLRADSLSPENVYPTMPLVTQFHSQYSVIPGGAAGLSTDASTVTVVAGKRRPNQMISLTSSSLPDFFEPNDSPGQATQLAADETAMIHQSWYEGDVDWVRFQGIKGILFKLETNNLSFFANPRMQLYAADGTTLLAENDNINPSAYNYAARIQFIPNVTGPLFVKLTDASNGYGPNTSYELRIDAVGPSRLDTNSDGKINTLDLFAFSRAWTPGGEEAKGEEDSSLSTGLLITLLQTMLR